MTKVTAAPGAHELSYERVFQATPELVYRAHTEADIVRRWWGGNSEVVVDKLEARPGGSWRYVSKAEDGTEDGFHGVFLTDQGDGTTKVTASSVFQTVEDRDGMIASGMESGMNDSLAQLDKVLASL